MAWDLRGSDTVETPPFSASLTVQEEIPSAVGIFRLTASGAQPLDLRRSSSLEATTTSKVSNPSENRL